MIEYRISTLCQITATHITAVSRSYLDPSLSSKMFRDDTRRPPHWEMGRDALYRVLHRVKESYVAEPVGCGARDINSCRLFQ